jgi:glycosyltransferase involved in cell wall biosynthesis
LLRNGFEPARIEVHAPVPPTNASGLQSSFSARNLIVYAGQVIRGKGVDVLLESLSKLDLEFECLILGEGSHKPYCEMLARRLGLESRVTFKGYVPPEEMRTYYSEASVAVMSSVWPEPFGAVGLEAMRYGLPVVAFDAGAIKEWLTDGENGFLVPHMDRTQFAIRVETLLRDKTLAREMGGRGRQLLQEKYSFDRYITGLEGMFTRVVAEAISGQREA